MTELAKLMQDLQKDYGEDAVMYASQMPVRDTVPSGSLALDFAIGVGGMPADRVVEIAGGEGTGKTTLALFTLMNFLDAQPDRGALILDTEHKLTASWVEQLVGVGRMSRVLLMFPDHMEQATDMYTKAVKSGKICFAMLDSIGGSPSMKVTEKSAEGAVYGGNSQAVTRFAQFAAIYSHKYHCLTVGINQIRADMDGYNRHITPGGHGWKHACVLRLKLKKGRGKVEEKINGEAIPIGYDVHAKVIKNHLGPEGRTAMWWFFNVHTDQYGFGIDTLEEIVRLSLLTGVVERRGAWYYHADLDGGKIQSQDKLTQTVKTDEKLRTTLVSDTMARLKHGSYGNVVAPLTDPDDDVDTTLRKENYFTRKLEYEG